MFPYNPVAQPYKHMQLSRAFILDKFNLDVRKNMAYRIPKNLFKKMTSELIAHFFLRGKTCTLSISFEKRLCKYF